MAEDERPVQNDPESLAAERRQPHLAFFRPGEAVLVFEPLARTRTAVRRREGGRAIPSLARAFAHLPGALTEPAPKEVDDRALEELRTALVRRNVAISGAGTSLLINRGADPLLMQVVHLDGRQEGKTAPPPENHEEQLRRFTAVQEAVQNLNIGDPERPDRSPVVVGGYRLVGAVPNWLTMPFSDGW
ncbi:MAG TPA: hypothetical protein VH916_00865 [Dehalococcoidia bacterium]|jgi:hypothetical protein